MSWGLSEWFSWYEYLEVDGLEEKIKVTLRPKDMCVIMTLDGEFGGIWAHHHQEVLNNADAVHDWMICMMKEKENRQGVWLWHIEKHAKQILGEKVGDLEDD